MQANESKLDQVATYLAARKARAESWRRNFPRFWTTVPKIIADDVIEFSRWDDAEGFVGREMIEFLIARRDHLGTILRRLQAMGLLISMFFLAGLLSIDADLSFFGLTLKGRNGILEVLLFLSATAGILAGLIEQKRVQISAAIIGAVRAKIPDQLQSIYISSAMDDDFNTAYTSYVTGTYITPTKLNTYISLTAPLIMLVMLVTWAVVSIVIHLAVILELWSKPGLPWIWTYLVICYVILSDIAAVACAWSARLPLPFRDWSKNKTLEILEQLNAAEYWRLMDEIYSPLIKADPSPFVALLQRIGWTVFWAAIIAALLILLIALKPT